MGRSLETLVLIGAAVGGIMYLWPGRDNAPVIPEEVASMVEVTRDNLLETSRMYGLQADCFAATQQGGNVGPCEELKALVASLQNAGPAADAIPPDAEQTTNNAAQAGEGTP